MVFSSAGLGFLLLLLTVTALLGLRSGNVGNKAFRKIGIPVLLITTAYFLLLGFTNAVGAESTPVEITTVNPLNGRVDVYLIAVCRNTDRLVIDRKTLQSHERATKITELEGVREFWTVGINDSDSLIYFAVDNGEYRYQSNGDYSHRSEVRPNVTEKNPVIPIAKETIRTYNRLRIIRNILITVDLLLVLLILVEMRWPNWIARKVNGL